VVVLLFRLRLESGLTVEGFRVAEESEAIAKDTS
jgi:hypothetical protein